jgi:hypothetical protein
MLLRIQATGVLLQKWNLNWDSVKVGLVCDRRIVVYEVRE